MEKKKVLKFILIAILTVIIIYAIYILRNYIIIIKIAKAKEEYLSSNNYSFVISVSDSINTSEGSVKEIEGYYKDGKGIETFKSEQGNFIFWYDENTKEMISTDPQKLTASITSKDNEAMITYKDMLDRVDYITDNKIEGAFGNSIKSTEINGEKCYAITNNFGILSTKYISAERGILLKIEIGNITRECKEWKNGDVSNEKVNKPDLEGYEVQDNSKRT